MEISNEEYLLMKAVKGNPLYPIKDNPLYKQLRKKKLISIIFQPSDDGQHTIETYIINPDKMWVYEKYEQKLKDNERSEEHSIFEKKSYKLDVLALIVACLALVVSFFALFK